VKLRTGRFSRAKAFSSTKRMDWSSSTIQMGFMLSCEVKHLERGRELTQGKGIKILNTVRPGSLSHSMVP
jgi:hypothetical protein